MNTVTSLNSMLSQTPDMERKVKRRLQNPYLNMLQKCINAIKTFNSAER